MWVGSRSSAATVAFGFPVMNGSTRMRVSPSLSSTADWPRNRISICSFLPLHEFVRQLIPDRDADQHRDAGLLGDQGTDGGQPLVDVGLAGGVEHGGLMGRAEPVGRLQRLVEDPLDPGRVGADYALCLLQPRRVLERLDGRLDL